MYVLDDKTSTLTFLEDHCLMMGAKWYKIHMTKASDLNFFVVRGKVVENM